MLNGSIGIIGGKTGPYNVAYFFNDYIDTTYTTITPVHILDKVGYYQTYTDGLPTITADGFYTNYRFVNGQIDFSYTELTTAVSAIDGSPPNLYLYNSGVAILQRNFHNYSITLASTTYFHDYQSIIPQNAILYKANNTFETAPDDYGTDAFPGEVSNSDPTPNALWNWQIINNNGTLTYSFAASHPFYYDLTDFNGLSSLRLYGRSVPNNPTENLLRYRDYNGNETAANLKGYVNNQLWTTDGDGVFSGPFTRPYYWEYNLEVNPTTYWAQDEAPAIRGTTRIYEGINSWTLVTNVSGIRNTGETGGSDNEFANTDIWRINEEGILLENIQYSYSWRHASGLWFADRYYSERAYTSGTGGDPILGTVYSWGVPGDTRYGIIVTGYYLSLVDHAYVINWKNPSDNQYYKMYFDGTSGSKAYVNRYSMTEFTYSENLEGISDIDNDGNLEQWTWDHITHQVTWTYGEKLVPHPGYLGCPFGGTGEYLEGQRYVVYAGILQGVGVGSKLWIIEGSSAGTWEGPSGGLHDPITPYNVIPYNLGQIYTYLWAYPTNEFGVVVEVYPCPATS